MRLLAGCRTSNNGEVIGYYGGTVLASAPSHQAANRQAQTFVRQGRQYLLSMRIQGHAGWHVVDGEQQSVLPLLHRANDPRGTPLAPRCTVSEYGLFRAARDIPPLDWTQPLSEQAASELSFEYGDEYWETHDLLGTADMPLDVVGLSMVDTLFAKLGLSNTGCRESKRPRRSQPAAAAPPVPNLSPVEADRELANAAHSVGWDEREKREGCRVAQRIVVRWCAGVSRHRLELRRRHKPSLLHVRPLAPPAHTLFVELLRLGCLLSLAAQVDQLGQWVGIQVEHGIGWVKVGRPLGRPHKL